jgi:hypothetical protein
MTNTPPSSSDLLAQAEEELHALLTGRQSVEVVQEGKGMVKYRPRVGRSLQVNGGGSLANVILRGLRRIGALDVLAAPEEPY